MSLLPRAPTMLEVNDPQFSKLDAENWRRRQAFYLLAGKVVPLQPGNRPDQTCVLGPGDYAAQTFADGADISGLNHPRLARPTITGSVVIRGCDLPDGALVQNGGLALFVGCRIDGTVTVALGGRCSVTACTLYGTGHIDNDAGNPVASAAAVANTRTSVTPHINTTIVAEV